MVRKNEKKLNRALLYSCCSTFSSSPSTLQLSLCVPELYEPTTESSLSRYAEKQEWDSKTRFLQILANLRDKFPQLNNSIQHILRVRIIHSLNSNPMVRKIRYLYNILFAAAVQYSYVPPQSHYSREDAEIASYTQQPMAAVQPPPQEMPQTSNTNQLPQHHQSKNSRNISLCDYFINNQNFYQYHAGRRKHADLF